MIDVEEYLALGFTGIVILDSDWHEEQSGYQPETTTEQVACLGSDGEPRRLEVVWFEKFFPARSTSHRIKSDQRLSREEYDRLVAQRGGVRDTPARAAQREGRERARSLASAELARLRPSCPTCKRPMVRRETRSGSRVFWGCTQYPACSGTRSMKTGTAAKIQRLLSAGAAW